MSLNVSVDINLGDFQQEFIAQVYKIVPQTIAMVAEKGVNMWRNEVSKAKLWIVEKDAYVDSIDWHMTGATTAEITSTYKLSGDIETGRPSYDMKKCLQTSNRTRVSKKTGNKYLIIPFIHNTPGNIAHAPAMPKSIYKEAKKLTLSFVVGETTRISGSGHTVKQDIYNWGKPNGRLPNGMLGPNQKGKHDRYSGMVKMNTSTGKSKSSIYLTFRCMSESSTGWIMPAKPGLFIAKDIADKLQPILDQSISKALS
jgi:hypothetical protein